MARLDLNRFLETAAQIQAGKMRGRLAGEQAAIAQQQQEEQRRAQQFAAMAQLQAAADERQNKPLEVLGSNIKLFSPEGQAKAIGAITGAYANRAASPYTPGAYESFLKTGQMPAAPTPAPTTQPTPSTEIAASPGMTQYVARLREAQAPAEAPKSWWQQPFAPSPAPTVATPAPGAGAPPATVAAGVTAAPTAAGGTGTPAAAQPVAHTQFGDFPLGGTVPKELLTALRTGTDKMLADLKNVPANSPVVADIQKALGTINPNPGTAAEAQASLAQLHQARTLLASIGPSLQANERQIYKEDRAALTADTDFIPNVPAGALVSTLGNLWQRHQDLQKRFPGRPTDIRILGSESDFKHMDELKTQRAQATDPAQQEALDTQIQAVGERIQGRMARPFDEKTENQKLDKAIRLLGMMSPEQARAEGGKVFENLGIGYLAKGITSGFGGAKLDAEWNKLFGQIPQFGSLPAPTRAALVTRLGALSRILGRPFTLSAADIQKVDPKTKLELTKLQNEVRMQGTRSQILQAQLDLDRLQTRTADFKLKQLKAGGGAKGQKGLLTENATARELSHGVDGAWQAYQSYLKENPRTAAQIDNPAGDPWAEELALRRKVWQDKVKARNEFFYNRGWDITTGRPVKPGQTMPVETPEKETPAPPTSRIPPENRGAKATAAVSRGTAPAAAVVPEERQQRRNQKWDFKFGGKQYRGVSKAQFYESLRAQHATEAEANAIMRSIFKGQ